MHVFFWWELLVGVSLVSGVNQWRVQAGLLVAGCQQERFHISFGKEKKITQSFAILAKFLLLKLNLLTAGLTSLNRYRTAKKGTSVLKKLHYVNFDDWTRTIKTRKCFSGCEKAKTNITYHTMNRMTVVMVIYHSAAWLKYSWKTCVIILKCPLEHELLCGVYRSAALLKEKKNAFLAPDPYPIIHLVKYRDLLRAGRPGWKGYTLGRCCRLHHLRTHTASTDPPHAQEAPCGKNMVRRPHQH